MDHIGSGGCEKTTGASGVNIIIVGDGETNANIGDGMWDSDGAYDGGKVDYTRSDGVERTTSASGVNVIVVGDWETNGSLGDGMWERDGYWQSRRV